MCYLYPWFYIYYFRTSVDWITESVKTKHTDKEGISCLSNPWTFWQEGVVLEGWEGYFLNDSKDPNVDPLHVQFTVGFLALWESTAAYLTEGGAQVVMQASDGELPYIQMKLPWFLTCCSPGLWTPRLRITAVSTISYRIYILIVQLSPWCFSTDFFPTKTNQRSHMSIY